MSRLRDACLCVILLALTAVAYLPVWRNGFVDYDDELYIATNQHLRDGLSWSGFSWAWTNDDAPYWIPITWLSLQLDARLFSAREPGGEVVLSPAAFHGQNLLWHAASALLLFGLWRRLTGARRAAFLAAALFAVHPMHVESVAWAIERKDVLGVFFGVLTLWAYVRYVQRPGWGRQLVTAAAFLLSLLSKPMLITLPFALLLLDYWPLRRWRAPHGRLLLEKAPLFLLAWVIAGLTLVSRERHGSLVSFGDIPLPDRLANALTAYGWYVASTFCPWRLAALYPHPYGNWSPLRALAGAGCLLAVTAFSLRQARRRPWLVVGWLWFVLALLPVIGLAQGGGQAWADRFSYWPHVGFFVAVVWEVESLADRFHAPALVRGAAWALVLGGLAALTWVQVGYWHDSITLWEHALAVTEDNDTAHEYLARYCRKQGRTDEADFHLTEAYRIKAKRGPHFTP
jgi:protein O-mannosyl-transferase